MANSALHDRLDRLIALLEQQQVDNAALKARLDQQETPSPGRRAREHDLSSPTRRALQQADESYLGGVSGRVPEIRIPVRKRDSPDFSEFRRLSVASTDIEENPASGDLSTDIG
ncbi:uncharacterized protein MEPE_06536 [Melanopsichium pennsylvanicum]|uniref:Uncharacterized protein n=1 Tax=Melanopsichium pennsylvanicum TaxID=63383 RepID=A0AAJ5C8B2_9BASI|nr:uncharacterized protein MEPE_06536 [Melanopsichium pennsylvanicum]